MSGKHTPDSHAPITRIVAVCLHEELTEFVPVALRGRPFRHRFLGRPSVKDTIEAIGVPHTEVDVILVEGRSVGFEHRLAGGEVLEVFPRLNQEGVLHLRPVPAPPFRFILDVHLGKLARLLRMLGFDALYRNDYSDENVVALSTRDDRIVLTRDLGILRHGALRLGYWLRHTDPREQIREVTKVFGLSPHFHPFTRCLECNATLFRAGREEVVHRVPADVSESYSEFSLCPACDRVYWPGTHFNRMNALIESLRHE